MVEPSIQRTRSVSEGDEERDEIGNLKHEENARALEFVELGRVTRKLLVFTKVECA